MATTVVSSGSGTASSGRGAGQFAPKRQRAWRKHLPAYLMCAPTVILFLVFMAFPIVFVLYSSFLDWNGIESIWNAQWVGLDNYRQLIEDDTWWTAVQQHRALRPDQAHRRIAAGPGDCAGVELEAAWRDLLPHDRVPAGRHQHRGRLARLHLLLLAPGRPVQRPCCSTLG